MCIFLSYYPVNKKNNRPTIIWKKNKQKKGSTKDKTQKKRKKNGQNIIRSLRTYTQTSDKHTDNGAKYCCKIMSLLFSVFIGARDDVFNEKQWLHKVLSYLKKSLFPLLKNKTKKLELNGMHNKFLRVHILSEWQHQVFNKQENKNWKKKQNVHREE